MKAEDIAIRSEDAVASTETLKQPTWNVANDVYFYVAENDIKRFVHEPWLKEACAQNGLQIYSMKEVYPLASKLLEVKLSAAPACTSASFTISGGVDHSQRITFLGYCVNVEELLETEDTVDDDEVESVITDLNCSERMLLEFCDSTGVPLNKPTVLRGKRFYNYTAPSCKYVFKGSAATTHSNHCPLQNPWIKKVK